MRYVAPVRFGGGRVWVILDKDVVDEMILRTETPRNRLILELMARSGMRIGEVLGLRCRDIEDRRAFLISPKSVILSILEPEPDSKFLKK